MKRREFVGAALLGGATGRLDSQPAAGDWQIGDGQPFTRYPVLLA